MARIEYWCFELFAGGKLIAEIERIVAASDSDLAKLILLDGDAPGAAPGERTKPHLAGFFIVFRAALNREPWIVLVSRGAAAAFENGRAWFDLPLLKLPLGRPSAGEIAQ